MTLSEKWKSCVAGLMFVLMPLTLSSCGMMSDLRSAPTGYHLLEQSRDSMVFGARAQGTLLAPFPVASGPTDVRLFDHPLRSWEFWHGGTMLNGAGKNSADTLYILSKSIAPIPQGEQLVTREAAIRWVLGKDPLVVAIGSEFVPIRSDRQATLTKSAIELGMTYALASDSDLDRTATELVVLDSWPTGWKNMAWDPKDAFVDLRKECRHIQFDYPLSLREILQNRPWIKPQILIHAKEK